MLGSPARVGKRSFAGVSGGVSAPLSPIRLEVDGGVRLNYRYGEAKLRRRYAWCLLVTQGAAGVKDNVEVCAKDAANVYAWRTIY